METIVTLRSKTGEVKLPRTLASAVSLVNGIDLESKINNIDNTLTNHNHNEQYYLKSEVESFVNNRLSELNISTIYSKLEIDQLLSGKSGITHNHDDVYFKIDDFNDKLDQALSQGSEGLFLTRLDAEKIYATKDYTSEQYYTKAEIDAMFAALNTNESI